MLIQRHALLFGAGLQHDVPAALDRALEQHRQRLFERLRQQVIEEDFERLFVGHESWPSLRAERSNPCLAPSMDCFVAFAPRKDEDYLPDPTMISVWSRP